MKIKVTKNHDHKLKPAVTMAFKPRLEPYDVPTAIGKALIEAGAGEEVVTPKPKKKEA